MKKDDLLDLDFKDITPSFPIDPSFSPLEMLKLSFKKPAAEASAPGCPRTSTHFSESRRTAESRVLQEKLRWGKVS